MIFCIKIGDGEKYKKCCLKTEDVTFFKRSKTSLRNIKFVCELNPELEELCEEILKKIEMGEKVAKRKLIVQELLLRHPHYHTLHFVMGICLLKEDNFTEATIYFEKATEIFPLFIEAIITLPLHI